MSVIRNRGAIVPPADSVPLAAPDRFAGDHPGVWEMLTSPLMPDGRRREGATLLVFYQDGLVKLMINDRDCGVQAWVSAVGLENALLALERGLQEDTLEWRKPRPSSKKK